MKELDLIKIENEQIKDLFTLFFGVIQDSLEIKDNNRSRFSQITSDRNLRNIEKNKEIIQFEHFDSFIKNLQELEKNQAYLDTTEWKVLTLLSPSLISSQNPSATYEALDYLNQSEFLGENNYSVIKIASIIYSLMQSEPLEAAKMLVRLDHFDLLNEESLGKIRFNRELDIKLFTSVIEKLSLSGGTDHLLTQANLDKLLDHPELNLEVLAKFIQAEDKSKILTQEKFDLAINLKNLLTEENINQLIGLNTGDFEKIVPVLVTMHKTNILNQDNFLKFLDTFLNASINDVQKDRVDGVSLDESGSSISLVDCLCSTLVDFLSRVEKFFQEFFDDILKYFNEKTELDNNTIINQTVNTDSGASSRASLFGNSSKHETINKNEQLTSNIVNSR